MSVTIGRLTGWLAALTLFTACRPGEGQRCVCAGECRRGLVCAQNGRVLDDKECLPADDRNPGVCIEQDQADEEGNESVKEDLTIYHDVGGKRDFEPGMPTDDDGSSDAASTSTTSASTTGGSSSSTSSGSTGASSSGSTGSGESSSTTNGSTGAP
jgi:hypothetical protein